MSELSTKPVVKCIMCGKPLVITHLSTAVDDPTGKLLYQLLHSLGHRALCDDCNKAYVYYSKEGREKDFWLEGGKIWLHL